VPLAENAGEHSLAAGDVSGAAGGWEPGGNEVSHDLEPLPVTVKSMCRHRQTNYPDACASRVQPMRGRDFTLLAQRSLVSGGSGI
jgi:hypothetical protein